MADQNSIDRDAIKFQPLTPVGLLEQFNLPRKTVFFIRRYQQLIWLVVVAVLAAILGTAGFSTWREYREEKAAAALDGALAAKQDNRKLLDQVVQDFGSTASGRWARIELAFLDEKEGQRAQAIGRLTEINASLAAGTPLKPLVLTKLAGLCENDKQFDKAVAFNTELVALGDNFAATAYQALGRLNEQMGKKDEAVAMYNKYMELTVVQPGQSMASPMRDMVQARLNQLKK
ncbi:tetratricopeptide repeat protein [Desulfobulbus sp.]|uniref:tetratricopeptide repeat protein n=1 Tax=Desulfobulbus sp. TaxID=895 RepID=UPI00286ED438|nr:tetratricopeptide repeat protein [Desulfobulbus sp.]